MRGQPFPLCAQTLRSRTGNHICQPEIHARSGSEDHLASNADGRERVPRMNHVHAMLESDSDDVVLRKICAHGGETFPDLVRLIGLMACRRVSERKTDRSGHAIKAVRTNKHVPSDGGRRAGPQRRRWRRCASRAHGPCGKHGWRFPRGAACDEDKDARQ